jgi:hypothetical protein
MTYRVDDSPDTLPYAQQVREWMERNWRYGPCPVCGTDKWCAEGRVFCVPRMTPPQPGLVRPVFPVVCEGCGHTVWIGANNSGVMRSPIPDDLSGFDPEDEA